MKYIVIDKLFIIVKNINICSVLLSDRFLSYLYFICQQSKTVCVESVNTNYCRVINVYDTCK